MDLSTEVRFQSDYELLLESPESDRHSVEAMSLRGRRDYAANLEQTGERVRHGDFEQQLKDCCKRTVVNYGTPLTTSSL